MFFVEQDLHNCWCLIHEYQFRLDNGDGTCTLEDKHGHKVVAPDTHIFETLEEAHAFINTLPSPKSGGE